MVGELLLAAADKNVWLNTDGLEFLNGMLDWLGFKFAASWNLNDERNVDIDDILPSFVSSNLADSFKEWLALDVADGAAYLNDGDVDVFLLGGIDEALNLVNDVRDDLDGFAKIFATSFFG